MGADPRTSPDDQLRPFSFRGCTRMHLRNQQAYGLACAGHFGKAWDGCNPLLSLQLQDRDRKSLHKLVGTDDALWSPHPLTVESSLNVDGHALTQGVVAVLSLGIQVAGAPHSAKLQCGT
jgi:hypothetical protein